ncbi:hypothetical protein N0V88_002230 [Collariella sp. IMI 366227]|nr:hypothetical protein N0V88_002230 [Collariella sp. IMI 366227]
MSSRRTNVAHVEDVDENENPIGGPRYASSQAPGSPAKEQPNTGRARRGDTRRDSSSPLTNSALTDSDTTVHPQKDSLKKSSRDREKSLSGTKKALMASRPSVKHAKTTPMGIPRRDEAAYYGLDPSVTPVPGHMPGPPMPMPHYGSPSPSPLVMHQTPPQHGEYFPPPPTRPLESRFGGSFGAGPRPQSSMGIRQQPRAIEYDRDYDDSFQERHMPERTIARRPSTNRRLSKIEDDRRSMAPPSMAPPRRPASARPTSTTLAYRPPPSTPSKRGGMVAYDDEDPDHMPFFNDNSPAAGPLSSSYDPFPPSSPFQPRPRFTGEVDRYLPDYRTEVAGKTRRRNSYYGGGILSTSSGSAYEDKMRLAARYQDDVTGGPAMTLTAESLRRAGRSGASSRSTRSSGSHDESEYRQSATTRTTRSTAPNGPDEDVTIRIKGGAYFKFGNSEMQCPDGAEINITSRGGVASSAEIRTTVGGSDRASSYMDPHDDRRTRVDMPTQRQRAQSRAKSRARSRPAPPPQQQQQPPYGASRYDAIGVGSPGTEYDVYPYGSPPPPPEYPTLGASYGSYRDGYYGAP